METGNWPTVAQVLDYLRAMGFVIGPGKPGYTVAKHPTDGSWFAFRDGDPNAPARAADLVDMKWQLPGRGFVTDDEFARFWNPRARRAETPAPAVPQ
jgi:hypothetical protein